MLVTIVHKTYTSLQAGDIQSMFTTHALTLTGQISDTFNEVADISESLSTESFSLTRSRVCSECLAPLDLSFERRSEEERVLTSSTVVTNP